MILFLFGAALTSAGQWYLPQMGMPEMGIIGWPFLLTGLLSTWLFWREKTAAALASITLGASLFPLILVLHTLPYLESLKPSRDFGRIIHTLENSDRYQLASWRWFQPSFLFYAGIGTQRVQQINQLTDIPPIVQPGTPLYLAMPTALLYQLRPLSTRFQLQPLLQKKDMYTQQDVTLVRITSKPTK